MIAELKHGEPTTVSHEAAKKIIADADMDKYHTYLTESQLNK
jgi:hypothetical protein